MFRVTALPNAQSGSVRTVTVAASALAVAAAAVHGTTVHAHTRICMAVHVRVACTCARITICMKVHGMRVYVRTHLRFYRVALRLAGGLRN